MDEENMSKRKKLGIWIPDEKIYNTFLMKVAEKHGQTYGRTGDELLNAIILWLEREGEGGADSSGERGVCAHTPKQKSRPPGEKEEKIGIKETAPKEASYPSTPRNERLKAIGLMLFNKQIAAIEKENDYFEMSFRGIEKVIMAQNITEGRRVKDYIHTMEIKRWIGVRLGRYIIFSSRIANDLGLTYPEGYIEKMMERRKLEDRNGTEDQKA